MEKNSEQDLVRWLKKQEFDKEKALLCLKWFITRFIDGSWGAGDTHLFMLRLLIALDPEDKVLRGLYERIIEKVEMIERNTPNLVKDKIYAEDVYRDEGRDEAKYYAKIIKEKYGEEFFKRLWEVYLNYY
jgi:hypothetical protein